ncbi:hypothetical protein [Vibrio diabolicus]|uniref:hypothetical protein n=1 Tax=Vibrio diabolicus TaxID=50719 RepID=UPI00232D035C|nr:hypothetical protein [Vibrio diabolicus]
MNNKTLKAALFLIPNKLQNKAVSKALNFLFVSGTSALKEGVIVRLEVVDLKRSWLVTTDGSGYQPAKSNLNADITVRASLDVVLAAQDRDRLHSFLSSGEIEVVAVPQDKVLLESLLKGLTQAKLDALVARCYGFLKLKPKPRFDIKTVTLAEIKSARDVDWLRDEAVKLETSNLPDALRLMEIAHQARPSGPFIKRKVEEYRSVLAQQ